MDVVHVVPSRIPLVTYSYSVLDTAPPVLESICHYGN